MVRLNNKILRPILNPVLRKTGIGPGSGTPPTVDANGFTPGRDGLRGKLPDGSYVQLRGLTVDGVYQIIQGRIS